MLLSDQIKTKREAGEDLSPERGSSPKKGW